LFISFYLYLCFFLQLNDLKLVLGRLRQVLSRDFPDDTEALSFIPEEDEIDITKLENGLASTNTCATVQRFHSLFKDDECVGVLVYVGFCWNHMRDCSQKSDMPFEWKAKRKHGGDRLHLSCFC